MIPDLAGIVGRFAVEGQLTAVKPRAGGHINDSFVVTCRQRGESTRFLLQRLNDAVFPAPEAVMDNIQRVTRHLTAKLRALGVAEITRRVLTLVPTRAHEPYQRDETGGYWRLYRFIEGARGYQRVQTAEQAERAARAFGDFQRSLLDLPGPRLHETISGFHDTPSRFEALERVLRADAHGRSAEADAEIKWALAQRHLAGALLDLHQAGDVPERGAHHDAKISNVLFDRDSGEALCVVDLDTIMPGLALYDFGDMVRSMTCSAPEDERDLARVKIELPLFEALARGYLEAAASFLTPRERAHLVTAGKVITFEQGVRFLTDFLDGDTYYRVSRPHQNLDRCRTQFKLVESILRHEREMVRLIDRL